MRIFFCYIILLNFIPYILVTVFNNHEELEKKATIEIINEIKLLRTAENKVTTIEFEEYIKGVTYAEMPASFEIDALKAQAVAARTYTYRKIGQNTHTDSDICDDPLHCQAFREKDESDNYRKISDVVESTRGEIITYNGNVINALFHAASGGKTENVSEVWNGNPVEYLVSVESPGEEDIMVDFITEVVIDENEFINKLKTIRKDFVYDKTIRVIDKSLGGHVKTVKIGNNEFSGNELRSIFGLRSTNFEIFKEDKNIRFIVKGYGHGVGLSQWGAQAMAIKNVNYKDILTHYYLGTKIEKI